MYSKQPEYLNDKHMLKDFKNTVSISVCPPESTDEFIKKKKKISTFYNLRHSLTKALLHIKHL